MRESTRHRQAFECYFRLGAQRSLERLRDALIARHGRAPSLRSLERWSGRLGWQRRIDDLERVARRADRDLYIERRREAIERHYREGLLLQQTGVASLSALDSAKLSAQAAAGLVRDGIRIEREALSLGEGEPDEPPPPPREVHISFDTPAPDSAFHYLVEDGRG
jgi:hypothetical protein